MAWWLKRRSTGRGEWAISDLRRDYRICAFNEESHGGPHIHAPVLGPVIASVDLSESEADAVVRRYTVEHDVFDLPEFMECLTTWRSESKRR